MTSQPLLFPRLSSVLTRSKSGAIGPLSLQKGVDDKELRHDVKDVEKFGHEKGQRQIEERLLLPTLLAEDEIPLKIGVDDVTSVSANHVTTVLFSVYAHFAQLESA